MKHFLVTILALASFNFLQIPSTGLQSDPEITTLKFKLNPFSLSRQCLNTTTTILSELEFAECINFPAFRPLFEKKNFDAIEQLSGDFNEDIKIIKSIEPALVEVSKDFCKFPKCQDRFIQSHIQSTIVACQEDLKNNNTLAQVIFAAFVFYSPLHDSVCFENKQDIFCWDEFVRNNISLPNFTSIEKLNNNNIVDKICTLCNRAIVNTFFNFIPTSFLAQVIISLKKVKEYKQLLAFVCGDDFVNGTIIDPKTGKQIPSTTSTYIPTSTSNSLPKNT
ncbi:2509_t:CDS:2 [Racocetra fulgida]|uniref:2509_t:CDS:1 n=1 Tax=Racocetra fulgida TaxID=60492 RepID=A0A9N9A620_9GLOM|nr:2509_t:CDS:2 [Racocetra fulgida]